MPGKQFISEYVLVRVNLSVVYSLMNSEGGGVTFPPTGLKCHWKLSDFLLKNSLQVLIFFQNSLMLPLLPLPPRAAEIPSEVKRLNSTL